MTVARHAEIAGAGFGGLTAAIALLERGWTVRVHERTPFVRAEGFGISMQANALRVMKAVGILDRALEKSMQTGRRLIREDGRETLSYQAPGTSYRMSRQHIVTALADRVAALGGEIAIDSGVAGADPDGALRLENGRTLRADLVIGADGYNSAVRDSLGVLKRRRFLRDGAMRLVLPRTEAEMRAEPGPVVTGHEHWSGARRLIYSPCAPAEVYIAMSCLASDAAGQAVPVDIASWRRAFPYLDETFDRMERFTEWDRVKWVRFQIIELSSWSKGRVAMLGDAAHAMPPNLGQGGGCAMMNALSLAVELERTADIPAALAAWEARERPLTEHTQRWSRYYGALTVWPPRLRAWAFAQVGKREWLRRRVFRTANHVPTGAVATL